MRKTISGYLSRDRDNHNHINIWQIAVGLNNQCRARPKLLMPRDILRSWEVYKMNVTPLHRLNDFQNQNNPDRWLLPTLEIPSLGLSQAWMSGWLHNGPQLYWLKE